MKRTRNRFLWIWLLALLIFIVGNKKQLSAMEPPRTDTLIFCGYSWLIKESHGKTVGPGNNYFTGKGGNVWVDKKGKLHLRLSYRNGKWFCPEVQSVKTFGYGKFHFHLEPFSTELPKEIVFGIFTYDHVDSVHFHKEVDIEFSKWGKENNENSQYVIQPYEKDAYRFSTDFTRNTHHSFEILRKIVRYKSVYESGLYAERKHRKIAAAKKHLPYSFIPDQEHVNINVWLFNATPPEKEKEFEVVISKFEFEQNIWHRLLSKIFKKKK